MMIPRQFLVFGLLDLWDSVKKNSYKKLSANNRSFQRASPSIKRYLVVYAALFDEEVSYRWRWRVLHYSVFFLDIFLSNNRQWQICYLMTKILLDKFFFFSDWTFILLIFSSEKRRPVEYLGWIIYRLVGQQEVFLSWHFA